MMFPFWFSLATIFLSLLVRSSRVDAGAAALKVVQILHDGQVVTSSTYVTLRTPAGTVLPNRQPVRVGETLPDSVQVQVAAHETVLVASGRSHLTLASNSTATFYPTDTATSGGKHVALLEGTMNVDDPLDFYRVVSHSIGLTHHTTLFSITASSVSIVVTCTEGVVEATLIGSSSGGSGAASDQQAPPAFTKRVDDISPAGRRSISYGLGQVTTANMSVADDEDAAKRGDANAEYNLGTRYLLGNGVQQNYQTALAWYQAAAAKGNANALNTIGSLYYEGLGVGQNFATALQWFQRAAARGDANAENDTGLMYDYGLGVARDYATALHWYQLSAAQGNGYAQSNIGYMHDYGHGVPQDDAVARQWYQWSAAQGNEYGEYNLGYTYEHGRGVPPDDATALKLYQLAAAQGNSTARYSVGTMYLKGRGAAQDDTAALRWFQLAGNGVDEYSVGYMYETGAGVPKDRATALHWYQLAAARGDTDAKAAVARLAAPAGAPPLPTVTLAWYDDKEGDTPPGPHTLSRADGSSWIERRPDGSMLHFRTVGRANIAGNDGIVLARSDRLVWLFVPDKNAQGQSPNWLRSNSRGPNGPWSNFVSFSVSG